ncbi:potassium channel family protein [Peribacillus saganii]|nr:potassium channel family protein [Peribacillus saganii]
MSRGFPRYERLMRLLIMIFIFFITFGVIIHLAEPKTFTNVFDGIWWAVVTISTVGYGDFAPSTMLGKTIGIILIFSGAGLVSSYFATVAAMAVSSEHEFMEGMMNFRKNGHIIIVGWNERAKEIIRELNILQPKTPIVLIDETLGRHPLPEKVHFIRGQANLDEILVKANIKNAEKVLITSDLNQDEFQTDMFSITVLLAVKGCNPYVFCLVEILTKEYIPNALRAGADGIIQTNRFASELMVKSLINKAVPEFEMREE